MAKISVLLWVYRSDLLTLSTGIRALREELMSDIQKVNDDDCDDQSFDRLGGFINDTVSHSLSPKRDSPRCPDGSVRSSTQGFVTFQVVRGAQCWQIIGRRRTKDCLSPAPSMGQAVRGGLGSCLTFRSRTSRARRQDVLGFSAPNPCQRLIHNQLPGRQNNQCPYDVMPRGTNEGTICRGNPREDTSVQS